VILELGTSPGGALRLRGERSRLGWWGGDREDEFPVFGGDGDTRAGGEAVLLEPAAGEAEVWDGVSPLRVRVLRRKRAVMLSSRGLPAPPRELAR
jgi:hypothetical protein